MASSGILRSTSTEFILANIAAYQVMFQVGVIEPGQLELTLNNSALAYTVVGRSTGTTQIVGWHWCKSLWSIQCSRFVIP